MAPVSRLRRDSLRIGHLLTAAVLVAYVYTPAGEMSAVQWVVRLVLIPGLAATGFLMWKLPALRRRLRTGRASHVADA